MIPPAVVPVVVATEASAGSFDRMKALAGTWRPAGDAASPLRIRFSLTAGGSVLVEEWLRRGKPHSLTLYHRDGARLVATHYCPQGNQPRLVSAGEGAPAMVRFRFLDSTDLDAGEEVLTDLSFDLTDPRRPVRRERYRGDGHEQPSLLRLERE